MERSARATGASGFPTTLLDAEASLIASKSFQAVNKISPLLGNASVSESFSIMVPRVLEPIPKLSQIDVALMKFLKSLESLVQRILE